MQFRAKTPRRKGRKVYHVQTLASWREIKLYVRWSPLALIC
jgi:hypothetical protein